MATLTIYREPIGRSPSRFLVFNVCNGPCQARFSVSCTLVNTTRLYELIGSAARILETLCRQP